MIYDSSWFILSAFSPQSSTPCTSYHCHFAFVSARPKNRVISNPPWRRDDQHWPTDQPRDFGLPWPSMAYPILQPPRNSPLWTWSASCRSSCHKASRSKGRSIHRPPESSPNFLPFGSLNKRTQLVCIYIIIYIYYSKFVHSSSHFSILSSTYWWYGGFLKWGIPHMVMDQNLGPLGTWFPQLWW